MREKINTCFSSSIVWVDDVIPGKLLLVLLVASGVDQHGTKTGSLCLYFFMIQILKDSSTVARAVAACRQRPEAGHLDNQPPS